MNKIYCLAKTIALVWIVSVSGAAWAASGYISAAAGSVSVAIGKMKPHPAVRNNAVNSNTVIRTGSNSYAVLKFKDGLIVSMQANSLLQVNEYNFNPKQIDKSKIVFSMYMGGLRFVTGQAGKHNPGAFKLSAPGTTISIQGTDFLVIIANNATYSQVISGSISMRNAAGVTVLTAGQTALAASSTVKAATVPASSVPAGTFSQIAAIPLSPAARMVVPARVASTAATKTAATTTGATAATTTGATAATTAATTTGETAATTTGATAATTTGATAATTAGETAATTAGETAATTAGATAATTAGATAATTAGATADFGKIWWRERSDQAVATDAATAVATETAATAAGTIAATGTTEAAAGGSVAGGAAIGSAAKRGMLSGISATSIGIGAGVAAVAVAVANSSKSTTQH